MSKHALRVPRCAPPYLIGFDGLLFAIPRVDRALTEHIDMNYFQTCQGLWVAFLLAMFRTEITIV